MSTTPSPSGERSTSLKGMDPAFLALLRQPYCATQRVPEQVSQPNPPDEIRDPEKIIYTPRGQE